MKTRSDLHIAVGAADAAIARVLAAEIEARQAVAQAQLEVLQIGEDTRLAARALAERTERRCRAVAGAFQRELALRLAEIDAEAARLAAPQALAPGEAAALARHVQALACELVGCRP